jgi:acyl-CoA reductase-like NAD-dependent aldehyde dehydrogenase
MASLNTIICANPARPTDIVGEVSADTAASVRAKVAVAAAAQTAWAARPLDERISLFLAAIDAAAEQAPALGLLLSREIGKLLGDCLGEIRFACAMAHDVAGRARRLLPDQVRGQGPGRRVVRHRPHGVIAAIVPWNAPIILAMTKIAPALIAGNAVVVKPSPFAPLALSALVEAIAAHLPEPVLAVVNGGGEVGEALVGAPQIARVAFTGGTAVGRTVLTQAAARIIPCVLELGGNDPLVILDDFEPNTENMTAIIWGSFLNAGQVCMAAKRLLVPEHSAARFTQAYVETARSLFRVGDPTTPEVTMGPVINAATQDRLSALADASAQAGGRVIDLLPEGGSVPDEGYFLKPRLVTGLGADAPLVAEEQFGPIVPIVGYRDEAEMLALANAGDLGLSASVWTPDAERGWDTVGRIRAGLCLVNAHNRSGFSFDLPFGGIGASGFGREYGDEGVLEYAVPQAMHQPAIRAAGGAAYPTTV